MRAAQVLDGVFRQNVGARREYALASALVLGIKDASKATGAPALQWNDSGTDDHRWRLVTVTTAAVAP